MKLIIIAVLAFLIFHLLAAPVQTAGTAASTGCDNPGPAAWAQMSGLERAVYGLCAASQGEQ